MEESSAFAGARYDGDVAQQQSNRLGMVPNLSFLHSLAIGACVTPTDPVLSNSIVKGKFADKHIPKDLQKIIIAESGANDGLGYPFLFLALYLVKYTDNGGAGQPGGAVLAMGDWFGETWGYTILLSVVYGAAVGWIAKELLHRAEQKKFVDRELSRVCHNARALHYRKYVPFGVFPPIFGSLSHL